MLLAGFCETLPLQRVATQSCQEAVPPASVNAVCGCVPARVSVALPMARRLLHGLWPKPNTPVATPHSKRAGNLNLTCYYTSSS